MKSIRAISGLYLFIAFLLISSCSNKFACGDIESDKNFYRAKASSYSTKRDLSQEKALMTAKKHLVKEITKDIHKNTNMSEKLIFDSLKKGIKLKDIEIICKKYIKKKGSYRCDLAIEIPVSKFSDFSPN